MTVVELARFDFKKKVVEPTRSFAQRVEPKVRDLLNETGVVGSWPISAVCLDHQGVLLAENLLSFKRTSSIVEATSYLDRKRLLAASLSIICTSAFGTSIVNDARMMILTAENAGYSTVSSYFNLTQLPFVIGRVLVDMIVLGVSIKAIQRSWVNYEKKILLKDEELKGFKPK